MVFNGIFNGILFIRRSFIFFGCFLINIYNVIQEESAILWEMIVCVILSKNVHMNMGPILNGYRDMACVRIKDRRHELRRATRSTLQHIHKCIEVGGGIFENLL